MAYDSTDFPLITARMLDRDPKSLGTSRERVEYLRDFLLELPDDRFDMRFWIDDDDAFGGPMFDSEDYILAPECGTAACIGGWTNAIMRKAGVTEVCIRHVNEAGEWLGLRGEVAYDLFMPHDWSENRRTPAQAAAVLTHLLDTSTPGTTDGEVDWGVA